mmetsp:Transcript_89188/g.216327  ORF Transcript_89188/g.216327 Transcript_89188/m.216327 type:complete len:277 (-) Transcript_89188:179-1009(-)
MEADPGFLLGQIAIADERREACLECLAVEKTALVRALGEDLHDLLHVVVAEAGGALDLSQAHPARRLGSRVNNHVTDTLSGAAAAAGRSVRLRIPALELVQREKPVVVQVSLLEAAFRSHNGKLVGADAHGLCRARLRLVQDTEDARQVAHDVLTVDIAVVVEVIERKRRPDLVIARSATQDRQTRGELSEVHHTVAIRVEEVKQTAQNDPRALFLLGRLLLHQQLEALVEGAAVQDTLFVGCASEDLEHIIEVRGFQVRQALHLREADPRRRGCS